MNYNASYLIDAIDPNSRDRIVQTCLEVLKNLVFDAIAFRGNSGALIAPIVAYLMNKDIICVRKDGEDSHTIFTKVEGNRLVQSYVIIDDFIDTGNTIKIIKNMIALHLNPNAKCISIVLYASKLKRKEFIGIPVIPIGE